MFPLENGQSKATLVLLFNLLQMTACGVGKALPLKTGGKVPAESGWGPLYGLWSKT